MSEKINDVVTKQKVKVLRVPVSEKKKHDQTIRKRTMHSIAFKMENEQINFYRISKRKNKYEIVPESHFAAVAVVVENLVRIGTPVTPLPGFFSLSFFSSASRSASSFQPALSSELALVDPIDGGTS